jgi:carboxylesterase
MRWMGEYLAGCGYSVMGVRLAGHATHIDDMQRVHWQDWLASVEDGYHQLKGISEQVVVAGLSMGGVLTLLLAADVEVSGLITMSTPYALPSDPRLPLLRWFWRVLPAVPKGESDWQDPKPEEDHVDYPLYPTKAILQFRDLVDEMQIALPRVTAPALLMHSGKDGGIPYENMEKIFTRLGSQDKEMFTLENSGHVIVRDLEKELVAETADKFIRRITGFAE